MIILQKNFNNPLIQPPLLVTGVDPAMTYATTSPYLSGVVTNPVATRLTGTTSYAPSLDSSIRPEVFADMANNTNPGAQLGVNINRLYRNLAPKADLTQFQPTQEQVLATVGEGIAQPVVTQTPLTIHEDIPTPELTFEHKEDLPKLPFLQRLKIKGTIYKNSAGDLIDRLKAGEGYGSGITGSLGSDAAVLAGGLALAGGAYHLMKKRREKRKANNNN